MELTKEDLYKLYWEDKLTQKEIGKIYGKSQQWVTLQMKKCGILTKETTDIKTRFLYYVEIPENRNNCWEWLGGKDRKGYGKFNHKGTMMNSHRVSYILFIRDFDQTLCCLHKCDNPSCVNPDHLFLGTPQDNTNDMKQKGRIARGEKIGISKLTDDNVKEIKTLLLQGVSQVNIGKAFKVTGMSINKIKQGKTWNHVKGE